MKNWIIFGFISLGSLMNSCHSDDTSTKPASAVGKWVLYPPVKTIDDAVKYHLPPDFIEKMKADSLRASKTGRKKLD